MQIFAMTQQKEEKVLFKDLMCHDFTETWHIY